jgi:hypothetical protein
MAGSMIWLASSGCRQEAGCFNRGHVASDTV